jgi:hypothetical protein
MWFLIWSSQEGTGGRFSCVLRATSEPALSYTKLRIQYLDARRVYTGFTIEYGFGIT